MSRGSDPVAGHLTGFDDEVQLGQLGEILENDSVVMSIELVDQDQKRIRPTDELLWRGVTMSRRRGRTLVSGKTAVLLTPSVERPRTIQQWIKLEASDSPVLFSLRPITQIEVKGSRATAPNSTPKTARSCASRSGRARSTTLSPQTQYPRIPSLARNR